MPLDNKLALLFPELNDSTHPDDYLEKLNEYYNSVHNFSQNSISIEFNNKDRNHAVIVMSEIFKSAKNSIKIFAGNFSGEVSDSNYYISSLEEAIKSNKNVELIFEKTPNSESKCLKKLNELRPNFKNITIKKITESYSKKLAESDVKLFHFTIGDKNMFRYEVDNSEFKAFCNMDDAEFCKKLLVNFEILTLHSEMI